VAGVATVWRLLLNVVGPLLGTALSAAVACSGSEFSGDSRQSGGRSADGGQAGAYSILAGAGGQSLMASSGGEAGRAPGGAGGDDGGESGAGGGAGSSPCAGLGGKEFERHCYVDVTAESVHQVDALAACAALADSSGREVELLTLETPEEQAFVIAEFLSETTDAWLGLSCSSTKHADLTDCYCTSCEDGLLLEKRAAWTWPNGSSSSFGWSGKNPDGEGRCSALALNNANDRWGWVDRVCLSTNHQVEAYPVHSYRVLCEVQ